MRYLVSDRHTLKISLAVAVCRICEATKELGPSRQLACLCTVVILCEIILSVIAINDYFLSVKMWVVIDNL